MREAIGIIPAWVWQCAITAEVGMRDGAAVAEVTSLPDLTGWPSGVRVIARGERPHPGA